MGVAPPPARRRTICAVAALAEAETQIRSMRICKVWDAEYPWDVRAAKVARSLTEAGHEVHMVARNRDGRPLEEQLDECRVYRLSPLPALRHVPVVGNRLNAASMFPAFFNPRWIRAIEATAGRVGAEMILVRDLPLAPSAIWVGKRLGLPVVLDMAENYPAMIRSIWENGRQRWSDWLIRNPRAVEWIEDWTLRNIDHVIVVVEESGERLVRLGYPADRITLVSNTPSRSHVREDHPEAEQAASTGPLELVYLGLLEAPRGIATLIDAVAICRSRGLDLRLTLIGDGRERSDFESQAATLRLGPDAIRFLGYVQNAEALRLLRSAHVGLIPHHADESWNTTIPNKLFDYMAAGLPVIGSSAPPVERVINETGCGAVFRDRDAADLARVIEQMADAGFRARCSTSGREAVRSKYNWETDTERLLQVVEAFGALRNAA